MNRCEPAAETDPLHVHCRHVESLYVLAGALTLTLDGLEITASTGTWIQIPAGVAHVYACTGTEARFLELHTPSCGYGASLRGLPGFDQELVQYDSASERSAST